MRGKYGIVILFAIILGGMVGVYVLAPETFSLMTGINEALRLRDPQNGIDVYNDLVGLGCRIYDGEVSGCVEIDSYNAFLDGVRRKTVLVHQVVGWSPVPVIERIFENKDSMEPAAYILSGGGEVDAGRVYGTFRIRISPKKPKPRQPPLKPYVKPKDRVKIPDSWEEWEVFVNGTHVDGVFIDTRLFESGEYIINVTRFNVTDLGKEKKDQPTLIRCIFVNESDVGPDYYRWGPDFYGCGEYWAYDAVEGETIKIYDPLNKVWWGETWTETIDGCIGSTEQAMKARKIPW